MEVSIWSMKAWIRAVEIGLKDKDCASEYEVRLGQGQIAWTGTWEGTNSVERHFH